MWGFGSLEASGMFPNWGKISFSSLGVLTGHPVLRSRVFRYWYFFYFPQLMAVTTAILGLVLHNNHCEYYSYYSHDASGCPSACVRTSFRALNVAV